MLFVGQQIKNTPGIITESVNTIENCYDIILENEDYTIGKILEFVLYKKYFTELGELSYCGFIKKHPHDKNSIIRIAFKNIVDNTTIVNMFNDCIKTLLDIFTKIQDNFYQLITCLSCLSKILLIFENGLLPFKHDKLSKFFITTQWRRMRTIL